MPDPRVTVGPLRPPTRPPLMDLGERLTAAGALRGGECSQPLFRSLAALGAAWNDDSGIVQSLVGLLRPSERDQLSGALRIVSSALTGQPAPLLPDVVVVDGLPEDSILFYSPPEPDDPDPAVSLARRAVILRGVAVDPEEKPGA